MKKSRRKVKELSKILLPFKVTFPVTVEGAINSDSYYFPANKEVELTYPQYEALVNTPYGKYFN